MNESILYSILLLVSLGVLASVLLYIVSKTFYVYEDAMIAKVDELLPAANCAGCGSPGCKAFAERLVKSEDISDLFCPVGGNETMNEISALLGKEIKEQEPTVAVLLCNGSSAVRPKTTQFDGPDSCAISSLVFSGETDCQYGCLGKGDCVDVCDFDALYMDKEKGLPVVNADNCTSCGACVAECPKDLFELRPRNKRDLKIYVACKNEEKGGIAKKACGVACIGCSKCIKVCPKDAIEFDNYLAYIDADLCTLCRKCVDECPTDSIIETNFPPRKNKEQESKKGEEQKPKKEKKLVNA